MFIETFLLGLAYMLAPGPVLVETARRSIRDGMRSAAAVQCGAMTSTLLYAALFVSGVGRMLLFPGVRFGLGLLGSALLISLGISIVRDRSGIAGQFDTTHMLDVAEQRRFWRPFGVGMVLIVLSPYTLVFWLSVGSSTINSSIAALGAFLCGCALGCALAVPLVGQLGSPRIRRFTAWIAVACSVVLTVLGIQLGYITLLTIW